MTGLSALVAVAWVCNKRMGVKDCVDCEDDEDFQRVDDQLMCYAQDNTTKVNSDVHDEDFIRVEDATQECDDDNWGRV